MRVAEDEGPCLYVSKLLLEVIKIDIPSTICIFNELRGALFPAAVSDDTLENIPYNVYEAFNKDLDIKNVEGEKMRFTVVSMGNPHAVTFVEDLENLQIEMCGPIVENNPIFPNKTNVEFVQILDKNNIKVRVWERGVGETFACGTGACAAVVASGINGYTDENVNVQLPGGNLQIEWGKDNHIYMQGPAETIYDGKINDF